MERDDLPTIEEYERAINAADDATLHDVLMIGKIGPSTPNPDRDTKIKFVIRCWAGTGYSDRIRRLQCERLGIISSAERALRSQEAQAESAAHANNLARKATRYSLAGVLIALVALAVSLWK